MCKTVRRGKYQTGALLQSRLELATKLCEHFTITCWVRHPSGFSVNIKARAKNVTDGRLRESIQTKSLAGYDIRVIKPI